ncbi:zinc finger protein 556-like [Ctenocephalides felis]|uniref:zinc finger protein 556-like n=1 Tax=Ctenocephalides felis TaxID=7515 RepID=UPI000E6E169B|nr:zinc finger protein 556-like [Ctenocephalides felis]
MSTMCSKVFGNASALAKHKLTHSDERKYVCTMCAKAFKRQDHLNGHMLTHRNKKPYECKAEGCGKSYCDARSLRRHRENHHGSSTATDGSSGNQSAVSGSNTSSSNNNNSASNAETAAGSPSAASSLSPSTASGDASSPHGSSCIQYVASPTQSGHRTATVSHRSSTNHTHSRSNSTSSTAISAGAGNEGLTTQQLELISQIMQQTKQQSLQQQNINRNNKPPRTWNMQTQLQQSQKKTNNVTSTTAVTSTNIATVKISNGSNGNSVHSSVSDANKSGTVDQLEPKPVECNLCHRKFKNIPALNGHMRLHGGYFKKDSDNKKPDKKESALPPLQTASQSVRALIEEKIISRQQRSTVTTPTSTTPQVQQVARQQVQQIINRSSDFAVPATPPRRSSEGEAQYTEPTTTTTNNGKDATLIELLKRGTKLQVKRSLSDSGASASVQLNLQQTNTTTANVTAGEVFTLAYQNPTTGSTNTFYTAGDEVYVQDTAMLLQAVNSIQLLQQETDSEEQETLQDIASLEDYAAVSADLDVQSPEGNKIVSV